MTPNSNSKREDDGPVPREDLPATGYGVGRKDDHSHGNDEAEDEREPESAEDLRDFEPEVGALYFLLRRTPCDVVREQVSEKSLGKVYGETAKEEEAMGRRY